MPASDTTPRLRVGFAVVAFVLLAGFFFVLGTTGRRDPRALVLLIGTGVTLECAAFVENAKRNWPTIIGVALGTAFGVWGLLLS